MISAAEIAETATTEDGVEMASREVSMTTALDSSVVAGSTQAIRGAVAMKEHPVTVNSTGAADVYKRQGIRCGWKDLLV